MISWSHWRKQEERSLTPCQDSSWARHGQLKSLEKTRRKATYKLSRFQLSKAWSAGIIGEINKKHLHPVKIQIDQGMVSWNQYRNKKKGHLQPGKSWIQQGMVSWNHWRKQERPLTACQDSNWARHDQLESLKETRRKATYILSRFQLSKAWTAGIIGENKKKGHLQPIKISIEQGMVSENHWRKKEKGHLHPVEIPIEQGMVSWNHWEKQEERPLTSCQDSNWARYGQLQLLEKTRRKATYILSRSQLNKAWSVGIIEENKKKGHLHSVKIPIEQGMVI